MKTNVYVDGFNLYYGCLKGTPYKWLDLEALCKSLLPSHQIHRIRYFTARVKTQPGYGPGTELRQGIYLRAVATLPLIETHLGHYQSHPVNAHRYPKPATGSPLVRVLKTEEKGSDVNLASYLLLDCFRNDYEQAVVISNDADLATPIRMVKEELQKPIGIVFPICNQGRTRSVHLASIATFVREIRKNAIAAAQLPTTIVDAQGSFSKPATW